MEMKKLHMGTISYAYDSMDEVAHQLAMAFGAEHGTLFFLVLRERNLRSMVSQGARSGSIATGAQLATRGRRDMSSRLRDVVLSLALCHNVCILLPSPARLLTVYYQGNTCNERRR